MKRYRFKILIVCAILLGMSELANAACDQTLNPGANLASTVAAAAAGSTICLNSGSYGTVTLGTFTKSPRVTVTSVTGQGATMSLNIQNGANGVTFDHITFSGGLDLSNSLTKNITIQYSAFGTSQFSISTVSFNANNILVDHNTFGAFNATGQGGEGRLHIAWGGGPGSVSAGVVVTNNTFGPGGCSDGIQIGSYGIVVGPGNIFTGIVQGSCGPHVDAIQGYGQSHTTINGNYFSANGIDIGFYDDGHSEVITNNVFAPGLTQQNLQIGAPDGITIAHNTFRNKTMSMGARYAPPSGWVVENNVLVNSDFVEGGAFPGCGSGCIMRYNLKDAQSSTTPAGTNNISGSPTFVGGGSPSTWAGYQLAGGSLGKNAGNDGLDMGTTYYGSVTDTTAPEAPKNLTVLP